MEEINKLLERIESDLISDGYVDGNVVLKDVKKVRELVINYTRCCKSDSELLCNHHYIGKIDKGGEYTICTKCGDTL